MATKPKPRNAPASAPVSAPVSAPASAPVSAPASAPVFCTICGKPLTRPQSVSAGVGHLCAMGKPANRVTVASAPANYVTVANLHRYIVANKAKVAGISVSKMVKAIGGDKGVNPPVHPICTPVYCNGVRFVHPWLQTITGLQAIATGKFASAPAFVMPK